MVLSVLRGAIGFLTRLPVAAGTDDWEAFAGTPLVFPLVGYLVGSLSALPFLLTDRIPSVVVVAGYLAVLYLTTGINHTDGLADCGDAAVVHGDSERRHAVLKDSDAGVGAVLAVALVLAWLSLAALGVASLPAARAVGLVIAAEVGAKLGMALLVTFGTAAFDGFGRDFTERSGPDQAFGPAVVAVPALLLTFPDLAAAGAVAGGVLAAAGCLEWAERNLGGVNGDVFGTANELGRAVGLHLGLVVWFIV